MRRHKGVLTVALRLWRKEELLREASDTPKGQQDIDNQSDTENERRNRGHFDVENMSQVKRHAPTSSKARP
jgi:hypothetical protein